MRAFLLAAGKGERLRPLTDSIPKPLLSLAGEPLIVHHIKRLVSIGITDIVINVSHHAKQITNYLGDGKQWGAHLVYSYEPTALETGGGITQALPLLGNEPFLVISGDIFTDFHFSNLLFSLKKSAHLVLSSHPDCHPDFHLEGNQIKTSGMPKYTYGNIGLYHPRLFASHTPHAFKLIDVLLPEIKAGNVTGELYEGLWENITSQKQYETLKEKYRNYRYPE
ncbi:MAG: hypothetical protein A3I12_01600 [Gammaproteobacteria bacterium RIFCSPLOWO2_02_FULL_38_11]|nr:MAG: hypothetical protein A3B69_02210 [Gammaproteobacteria bacterium RIFCSPHIGHO2_02_FULL_38_33]OGT24600.1 MAG: hypothetical protein A2W47_02980 [Gammaproteobacteria bacterium RIFCSPHIGHO2_12_38_15]OGT69022.1 MAG: hypothetical protein A3I12_01600 [Gammaproteobacteria bacterium RIFCSPLOWO2_02_FULL_38_11]